MSRWVRCSYGKRAGFVNAKVGIQFQKTKGRVNKQVQHYNKRLKKRSFGVEKLSFFLGLLFSLS